MTTSIYGTPVRTASLNVPQTQNTAPVLEFRCLYTQDAPRKKQKRWQDGRLKFHTFNKRIMVYDERSNFMGDAHWREDSDFGEGEEVELDRSGICVEVRECIGKRDQDLTELVDKRIRERGERAAAKAATNTPSRLGTSVTRGDSTPASPFQAKPLNAMLTPSGHYGRALVPHISPYEEKQRLASRSTGRDENEPPLKRRREDYSAPSKAGYAQNLMGTTLTLTSKRPPSTATIRYDTIRAVPIAGRAAIDLTVSDEEDNIGNSVDKGSILKTVQRLQPRAKKTYKSPPARSGYASSLTGAALSLSRPEISSSSSNAQRAPLHTRREQEPPQISSSLDETHFETENRTKAPVKAKPARKVTQSPAVSMHTSDSSSKTSAGLSCRTLATNGEPLRTVANITNFNESHSDRPASSLKIKARPARKKMMHIDPPKEMRRVSSDPTPKPQTLRSPHSKEIVMSQATVQLDAFCKQQQDRLQARLNGNGPERVHMEEGDPPSISTDQGINHHTIDMLLCRDVGFEKDTRKPATKANSRSDSDLVADIKSGQTGRLGKMNALSLNASLPPVTMPDPLQGTTPKYAEALSDLSSPTIEQTPKFRTVASSSHLETSPEEHVTDAKKVMRSNDDAANRYCPEAEIASETDTATEFKGSMREASTTKQRSSCVQEETVASVVTSLPTVEDTERTINLTRDGHTAETIVEVDSASTNSLSSYEEYRAQNCSGFGPSDIITYGPETDQKNVETLSETSAASSKSSIPQHLSGGIQSVKDHFRSIINSETSLKKVTETTQSEEVTETALKPLLKGNQYLVAKFSSTMSNIKSSPKLSPLILAGPGQSTWAEVETTPSISLTAIPEVMPSRAFIAQETLQDDETLSIPRPTLKSKLLNPATRGKSVHDLAAATTLDISPAPVFRPLMSPPILPPQASRPPAARVERIYPKPKPKGCSKPRSEDCPRSDGEVVGDAVCSKGDDDVGLKNGVGMLGNDANPSLGTVVETTELGPWSRESFDLFGCWRRPLVSNRSVEC